MNWHDRIRAHFHGDRIPDDDVIDELAQHAAAAYEAARAEGCSADEADRRLQDQLSAWSRDASVLRRRRARHASAPPPPAAAPSVTSGLAQDLRYALRVIGRERWHASLVIGTMTLGIAAATALFSVTYGVLMRPLPWPEPDRIVRVMESRQGGAPRVAGTVSNGTFLAWRTEPATIEDIGGWMNRTMTLTGAGNPERLTLAAATPGLFTVLRARPASGRLFNQADAVRGRVVILSHGLWQERFGGRGDTVGRGVRLDGEPHTIVGVMPPDFPFPVRRARAWIPLDVPAVDGGEGVRRMSIFSALARLKPGVSTAQAAAEATARGRAAPDPGLAAMALFGSSGPVEVSVVPALDAMTAEVRPALMILLAAVGLLLATATANVASLQLARVTTRRRELAVRAAIGAGAGRLARQLLVESTVLGVAGGAAGLLVARLVLRAIPAILPADFPRVDAIAIDTPVVIFAVGVSLVASAAFGLLPALHARRVDLVSSLSEDHLAPVGGALRSPTVRARAAIMAGQVAVACVLLIAGTLLTRSLVGLMRADRGFDPGSLLTARVPLPADYLPERRTQMLEEITARLRGLPGVTHAAYANGLPLMNSGGFSAFTMRSPHNPAAEVQVEAAQRVVSPDYFGALRLRLRGGRALEAGDTATSRPVLVVNQSFARRYLGDRPIGARIPWHRSRAGSVSNTDIDWEVVGIVDDVRQDAVDAPGQPEMIVPYAQVRPDSTRAFDPILVIRTTGDPASYVAALRQLLRDQDASLALDSVMTMEQRVATSLAAPRTYAVLVGGFAVFAALIATVGLFGVLAYTVAQRSREIGIRTALGASPGAIVSLVLRQALWVTVAGLAAGIVLAIISAQALSRLLYGVQPRDPASFAAVAGVLLALSAAATVVPARRAASVDPLKVLR